MQPSAGKVAASPLPVSKSPAVSGSVKATQRYDEDFDIYDIIAGEDEIK